MAQDFTETAAKDSALCTVGGCDKPRAKSHDWCADHKADAQRKYVKDRDDLLERRGFAKGVTAMRDLLVERFDAVGGGMLSGVEAARFIQQVDGPRAGE